jgi:hypothetical protein
MKKRKVIKRKRRNPDTPTSKENMVSYLHSSVKDTSIMIGQNYDDLSKLTKEDLSELIGLADNLEKWILFKLGKTPIRLR